jgi:type I restriction enzyme M protein
MNACWEVLPGLRNTLFKNARKGYLKAMLAATEIKSAIHQDVEFETLKIKNTKIYESWKQQVVPQLNAFGKDAHPKDLIGALSESLLNAFKKAKLIDAYDLYQHLMNYWNETMQDDAYLIAADGWKAEIREVIGVVKSGKNKGEKKEKGWTCDLLPKEFIVNRLFKTEQDTLLAKQNEMDDISGKFESLIEENSGEEGILRDVSTKGDAEDALNTAILALWNEDDKKGAGQYSKLKQDEAELDAKLKALHGNNHLSVLRNSKGKLTLKAVKDKLASTADCHEKKILQDYIDTDKSLKDKRKAAGDLIAAKETEYKLQLSTDPLPERLTDLNTVFSYLEMLENNSALKSDIKKLDEELDALAFAKYPDLSEAEVKAMVLDDKWLPAIEVTVKTEMDRISQQLIGRVKELIERYDTPLPLLDKEVKSLEDKVSTHLKKMGFVW